jgi:hypothetical protein
MDLEQQPHTLSSMRSLLMTQMWMNPNWKYPIGLTKDKLRNRLPMDGEGDELQQKKSCQFLLVYFEDCFRTKFGVKAFHFKEGPAPTCQSTLHNLEGTTFLFLSLLLFLSHWKSEWPRKYLKVLYANKGSIVQPFCNFWQTALVLVSLMTSASNHGSVY